MLGHVPNPRDASRSVLLVVTLMILLCSLGTTIALVYYSLTMESQATVSSPPVILQKGTAGTSMHACKVAQPNQHCWSLKITTQRKKAESHPFVTV